MPLDAELEALLDRIPVLRGLPRSVVEIYRDPSPQGYREMLTLRRGDRISPLAFPDLQFDVDAILG